MIRKFIENNLIQTFKKYTIIMKESNDQKTKKKNELIQMMDARPWLLSFVIKCEKW